LSRWTRFRDKAEDAGTNPGHVLSTIAKNNPDPFALFSGKLSSVLKIARNPTLASPSHVLGQDRATELDIGALGPLASRYRAARNVGRVVGLAAAVYGVGVAAGAYTASGEGAAVAGTSSGSVAGGSAAVVDPAVFAGSTGAAAGGTGGVGSVVSAVQGAVGVVSTVATIVHLVNPTTGARMTIPAGTTPPAGYVIAEDAPPAAQAPSSPAPATSSPMSLSNIMPYLSALGLAYAAFKQ